MSSTLNYVHAHRLLWPRCECTKIQNFPIFYCERFITEFRKWNLCLFPPPLKYTSYLLLQNVEVIFLCQIHVWSMKNITKYVSYSTTWGRRISYIRFPRTSIISPFLIIQNEKIFWKFGHRFISFLMNYQTKKKKCTIKPIRFPEDCYHSSLMCFFTSAFKMEDFSCLQKVVTKQT